MNAMVLQAPRDLTACQVDAPARAPGDVIVRITHSGICGTDLKIFTGAIPVAYPRIMGHEMSGEVVEDAGVFARGDRVVIDPVVSCGACEQCRAGRTNLCAHGVLLGRDADGGFAELLAVPPSQLFRLPDGIEPTAAPAIQVLTTCVHAQRRVAMFPGQPVVVFGLGVTGQLHVQLAKARGAHPVVGVTRSAWKRELAMQLGADITLAAGDDGPARIVGALGGRAPDVVIETTGTVRAIAESIATIGPGGTLVLFGITTASEAALPFYDLYFKELTIVNARAAKAEDFPDAIDLVARGAVRLMPLVTQRMPLSDLVAAIDLLRSDVDGRMKVVMVH